MNKMLLMTLLCLMCAGLHAAAEGVDYLNYEGHIETKDCIILADQTEWGASGESTWYAARDSVTITESITVSGNVNLILADGAVLEAGKGIVLLEGNSLTVWGQKKGTGCLNATGDDGAPGIGSNSGGAGTILVIGGAIHAVGGDTSGIGSTGKGSLRIAGGSVTAEGSSLGHGVAFSGGEVIVEEGKLTATGGDFSCGLSSRSLRVYGGRLEATAGCFSYGIACNEEIRISGGTVLAKTGNRSVAVDCEDGEIMISGGNVEARSGTGNGSGGISGRKITLSWTRLTDSVYANSYLAEEMNLKSAFLLKGTTTAATTDNIDGKTIVPDQTEWIWTFSLPEGVTSIHENAFSGIAATHVYLPDSCRSIGVRAFADCSGLVRIRVPWRITYDQIAPDAFSGVDHVVLVGMKNSGAEKYAHDETHTNCEFEEE